MVSGSDGGLFSDAESNISASSDDSDTHLNCLVDDIISKLNVNTPSSKIMTIKNRKDRLKHDSSEREIAGPSRHPHSYRPYAYPEERKENAARNRTRGNHTPECTLTKNDGSLFHSTYARPQTRHPPASTEIANTQFDCRIGIRDSIVNQHGASIDKENGNNSEDEYHSATAAHDNRTTEADETNLERLLMEKRGWKVVKVKADGACLFRSVAHQIFGDEEKHDLIRKQVTDYMLKNKEHFSPYITEDFDHYVRRKRDPTCYGNHVEIQAITELYNRSVEIYHDSVDPINVFHADYSKEFPIRLSYHGRVHYNSVVDPFKPSFGHGLGMPNYQPSLTEPDLIAQAIRESEVTQLEETLLHDKLTESEQLDIDRCIEAEVVRESYFDYLNQLKSPVRRAIGSPTSQSHGALPLVPTPSPPSYPGDVASSSNPSRYISFRSTQARTRSPIAIPSCSRQPQPGMDEDSVLAMVLEQSRLEYLESLKKRRSSPSHESDQAQESQHTERDDSTAAGHSGPSNRTS